jgi:ADP-ribose pyrophosphatase
VRLSDSVPDPEGWETRSRTTRYADEHVEVVTEEVKTPSRAQPKLWTTVLRKNAVVVASMTSAGKFLLVREERIPVRSSLWEMPAGQIDGATAPNQKQIEAEAVRELREETRHQLSTGGELLALGYFFSSPGFTNERCYFFLARPVEPCGPDERDEMESILECRAFAPDELRRMIVDNEIRDANTLSICARLAARGFFALEAR